MPKKYEVNKELWELFGGTPFGQALLEEPSAVGDEVELPPGFQAIIDLLKETAGQAAASDTAASALEAELAQGQLGVAQGQLALGEATLAASMEKFGITQEFLESQEEFKQQDIINQRLLEAAGLATGPTGAIQLAYLARGAGAPHEEVASIFQNLPFVQELLHGQNISGFGRPEQLGGPMRGDVDVGAGPVPGTAAKGGVLVPRAPAGTPSGAIQGRGLGVTIPGKKSVTRQAYGTLSALEQEFLGALGQSETGQSAAGFLEDIIKSFIPTRTAGAVSIA